MYYFPNINVYYRNLSAKIFFEKSCLSALKCFALLPLNKKKWVFKIKLVTYFECYVML